MIAIVAAAMLLVGAAVHSLVPRAPQQQGKGAQTRLAPGSPLALHRARLDREDARWPHVFLIGVQIGGIPSIADWLWQQGFCRPGGIDPATGKKFITGRNIAPDFFNNGKAFAKGAEPYLAHFSSCDRRQPRFDASTTYLTNPPAANRAARMLPPNVRRDAKVIVVIRESAERDLLDYNDLVSACNMKSDPSRGRCKAIFPRETNVTLMRQGVGRMAYKRYAGRMFASLKRRNVFNPVAGVGDNHIWSHLDGIRRWVEAFGREKVLVLNFEELMEDPTSALARISGFLGLRGDEWRASVSPATGGVSGGVGGRDDIGARGDVETRLRKLPGLRGAPKGSRSVPCGVWAEMGRRLDAGYQALYHFLECSDGPEQEKKPWGTLATVARLDERCNTTTFNASRRAPANPATGWKCHQKTLG